MCLSVLLRVCCYMGESLLVILASNEPHRLSAFLTPLDYTWNIALSYGRMRRGRKGSTIDRFSPMLLGLDYFFSLSRWQGDVGNRVSVAPRGRFK